MPRTAPSTRKSKKKLSSEAKDTILVLWNDDGYAVRLGEIFRSENVVTSSEQLKRINFQKRDYTGIAMLVEMNWEDNDYSKLHGIEIAKTLLRVRMKLHLPILFLSFLSVRQIKLNLQGQEILERQIVGAVGHDSLRLPAVPQEWLARLKTILPLTDLQFTDVFNNLCNVKGLVEGAIHKLQGRFRDLDNEMVDVRQREEIFKEGIDEILYLLGNSAREAESRRRFPNQFRQAMASGPEAMQHFLSQCGEELKSFVVEENSPSHIFATGESELLPWKIILLDDEPSSLASLLEAFAQRGVECIVAMTVSEAKTIVAEDVFNEILVAISDYRLLERVEGIERHQRQQGYDFLFELASQDRHTHLVALSGLSRKFLLESFQKYNTRVEVYSKQDLNDKGAINLFADTIIDRGQETYDALYSRPLVGDWKTLRPFYYAHRQSSDYRLREQEVCNRARRFVLQLRELVESKDEALLLHQSLEVFDDLTADLAEKSPSHDVKALKAFKNKLVARRIAIWLNLRDGSERDQIYAFLSGHLTPESIHQQIERVVKEKSETTDPRWIEKAEKKAKNKLDDRVTHLLTTRLALSFPISSLELLVEEKRWLKYEMGIEDVDDLREPVDQIYYFVHVGVEKLLEIHPELIAKVNDGAKAIITKTGKPMITSLGHARTALTTIRNVLSNKQQKKLYDKLLHIITTNVRASLMNYEDAEDFISYMAELSLDGNGKP